ncbi:TIGR02281 family clan AA aspartic protease [uncultured Sphingomonas sp.]|uniref:retropepsin-like aspartic protease family protein n=1 Tax=uncultured Sphingomonas sp. TaxID=158754 RepID=UPI0035CC7257
MLLATALVPSMAIPRSVGSTPVEAASMEAASMEAAPIEAVEVARAAPTTGTVAAGPTIVEQADDGLFYITVRVNDASIQFVVDTGASVVVLSARDAARAGVLAAGSVAVDTAGGVSSMRRARIERVVLAGQTMQGVDAAIVDRHLETSLLGQSALSQLGSVTFRKTRLELE